MSRTQTIIIATFAASALLAPGIASAQSAAEAGDAGIATETEAPDADAGAAEPELEEPFVPGASAEPSFDDGKPFAKGDMEPGVGLAFAAYDGDYYMIIGASFAYYVVNHFAPGLEVSYGTDFGSANIPDSVTLLPFAKFVILRSTKFAPYLIALGGREFQFNGYHSVHSWIVGGGAGVQIGLGEHISLKIEVTFQHHWYDDPRIRGYKDGTLHTDENGNQYPCPDGSCNWNEWVHPADTDGEPDEDVLCQGDDIVGGFYQDCVQAVNDKRDLTHEWIVPIISVGMAFSF